MLAPTCAEAHRTTAVEQGGHSLLGHRSPSATGTLPEGMTCVQWSNSQLASSAHGQAKETTAVNPEQS